MRFAAAACISILAALPFASTAQTWPAKPIRIVVPTGAVGPLDVMARWMSEGMAREIGQSFYIENKPGGVFQIGLQEVQRAPADGHNIAVISMATSVSPSVVAKYAVDLNRDFVAVGRIGYAYNVLVVPTKSSAQSIADLVRHLKANPGKFSYLSGGPGTPAHVVGELFKIEAGVDALHVPFTNFAQGIGNMIDGQIDYGFITSAPMVPQINAGKLRGLAVSATKRLAALPNIPTVAEAGFPNLQVSDWVAFLVKAGTPGPIVEQLNAAMRKVLTAPEAMAGLAKFGAEPAPSTSDEMQKLLAAEIERWGKVARAANIRIE